MHTFENRTVVVTGASRGFGRATAVALANAGARVVGVARTGDLLRELEAELGDRFVAVPGDASSPDVVSRVFEEFEPRDLVLNAGALPITGSLIEQSWDSFSTNWNVDTQHVFHWIRAALQRPLVPGGVVVSVSSGAALADTPRSGGYSPAKAAIRFISNYAAFESSKLGLELRFVTLLPRLTPATQVGRLGVEIDTATSGIDSQEFLRALEPLLTPAQVGETIIGIMTSSTPGAFLMSADGLRPLGGV
jgi:NAD(P)-dependent dehydrogenase (short-subunit alcohol dehydrogenase family)